MGSNLGELHVRGALRVNFILGLIGMLNIVVVLVNFIFNFIFKSDWHAKFSMIMIEILFP